MLLSAHLGLYNAVENDFPFVEVVRSVLPVADEVLLACPPEDHDGTREVCETLQRAYPHKVKLHLLDWWDPPVGSISLANVTNYLIEKCKGKWHFSIQADEVLHENQMSALLDIIKFGRYDWYELNRFNFFGTFDSYNARLDRWPCSVVRLAKRELYPIIRSYGDATHLGILDVDPSPYPRGDMRHALQLWHYSYVRWPSAYVKRQKDMANLYGLNEDPRIVKWRNDGRIVWEDMAPFSENLPIPCAHPKVMREWIEARRAAVESGML